MKSFHHESIVNVKQFFMQFNNRILNDKKPVNVNLQMILAIIPILDILASYKVQKLRLGFLFFWAGGTTIQIIQFFVFFGEEYYVSFGEFESRLPESVILFTILFVILKVVVMRKWSSKWNESILELES